MNKKLLFTLFVAFSVMLLPTAFAEEICPQSVHDLAASCPGGTLTSDTVAGSCRSLVCEDSFGTDLSVLACDKPGTPADFFEMYQLSSGSSGVQSCLGDTCLNPSVSGFVKSDDFDTCDEPPVDPVCGNDVVEGDEECDGSAPEGYICTETCELEEVVDDEPTDEVCLESVFDAEVSCDGTITEDVDAGGCRKVSCGLGGDSFTALACDKPVTVNPDYFEIYNIGSTGSPNFELCFGNTCMNPAVSGFARSEDFGVCEEPVACETTSVWDMEYRCTFPGLEHIDCSDWFTTQYIDEEGNNCVSFHNPGGSAHSPELLVKVCDGLEEESFDVVSLSASLPPAPASSPNWMYCIDDYCMDEEDYGYEFSLDYCPGDEVCGDGIVEGQEQCDDGNLENDDGCNMFCRYDTSYFKIVDTYFEHEDTGERIYVEDGDTVFLPRTGVKVGHDITTKWNVGATLANHDDFARDAYDNAFLEFEHYTISTYTGSPKEVDSFDFNDDSAYDNDEIFIDDLSAVSSGEAAFIFYGRAANREDKSARVDLEIVLVDPVCEITSVHDMEYSCILTDSGEDCPEIAIGETPWWTAEQYVNEDGNNCVDFADYAFGAHDSGLYVTVCDNPETGSFDAEVTSATMPPAPASAPGHAYCLDGQCIDEEDFGYVFSRDYCPGAEYCGNGIIESQEQCDDGNTDNDDGCNMFCRYDTSYFDVVETFFKNTATDEVIYFVDGDTVSLPQSDMSDWVLGATLANHDDFARDAYDNAILEARYYAGGDSQIYNYDYGSGYENAVVEVDLGTVTSGEASMSLRGRAGGETVILFDIVAGPVPVCFESVEDAPVSCGAGEVTADTWNGCRTVTCSDGGDYNTVKACDKDGFFEIYAVAQSSPIEVCFGDSCISNHGFVLGDDFVACE